jgi:predicted phage terminase large subunit-like protein
VTTLEIDDIRNERIRRQKEWYLSEEGFLDFVRDSGAAPDAVYEPHGRYCQSLIHWEPTADPDIVGVFRFKGKLVLWPRGSFKSQVFNVGQAAWLIAQDPNVRILVCSETNKQAIKFVKETMKIVESEWFKELFGDHTGGEWKPGTGQFTSALRTRKGIKDPTLCASGVGEVQTGAHWDFIFMDDICSQENTRTPEAIEALWNWFGEIKAQLDPGILAPDGVTIWGGRLFIIGTLHHYSDIYCRIMKDEELAKDFDISRYAWSDPVVDPRKTEEEAPAKLFFPGRLTRSFIAAQKRGMSGRLYACFYENRPTTGEQQLFRPEYFRTIPDENIPSAVWTYILSDFAFIADEKKKDRADRTCFWVVSIDCNRVAYVLDCIIGRWKPSDSVRIACDLWNRYQWATLKGFTVEKTCYNELLSAVFEEVRRQTHIMPKFITIGGRSQEIKDMRIEAAEPRWKNGDIYFAQSLRDNWRKWKPMFDEMTEWPFSSHDDVPDAISDLDKKDESNPHYAIPYCPSPPVGWAQQPVKRFQPPLINQQWNPDLGYPARETTKANQGGHDIWGPSSSTIRPGQQAQTQEGQSDSIFQKPPPQQTRWP